LVELRLLWFDLTAGLPTAVKVLWRRLGMGRTLRVLLGFMLRGLHRPFASLGPPASDRERFTRHQLKPVLILDDILQRDLGLETDPRMSILADVVGQSGAKFIDITLAPPTPARWRQMADAEKTGFVDRIMDKFLNAEAKRVDDTSAEVAFDVSRCHFVDLTRRLERTELAPLFCGADSVYFDQPDSPLRLVRDTTLASGGEACRFRFHLDDED
jgi:hypothetical protein